MTALIGEDHVDAMSQPVVVLRRLHTPVEVIRGSSTQPYKIVVRKEVQHSQVEIVNVIAIQNLEMRHSRFAGRCKVKYWTAGMSNRFLDSAECLRVADEHAEWVGRI